MIAPLRYLAQSKSIELVLRFSFMTSKISCESKVAIVLPEWRRQAFQICLPAVLMPAMALRVSTMHGAQSANSR